MFPKQYLLLWTLLRVNQDYDKHMDMGKYTIIRYHTQNPHHTCTMYVRADLHKGFPTSVCVNVSSKTNHMHLPNLLLERLDSLWFFNCSRWRWPGLAWRYFHKHCCLKHKDIAISFGRAKQWGQGLLLGAGKTWWTLSKPFLWPQETPKFQHTRVSCWKTLPFCCWIGATCGSWN